MEALNHLVTYIPDWMRRLDDLNRQIDKRQLALAQLAAQAAAAAADADAPPSSVAKSVRNRGSTESIRPRDEGPVHAPDARTTPPPEPVLDSSADVGGQGGQNVEATQQQEGQQEEQPQEQQQQLQQLQQQQQQQQQERQQRQQRQQPQPQPQPLQEPPSSPAESNTPSGLLRQADQMWAAGHARMQQTMRRRVRSDSIISAEGQGPKYRSRNMIIVYYDSYVQSFFEEMVRFISGSRNMMRKAKMAAKVAEIRRMAEMDTLSDEDDGGQDPADGDALLVAATPPTLVPEGPAAAAAAAAAEAEAEAAAEEAPGAPTTPAGVFPIPVSEPYASATIPPPPLSALPLLKYDTPVTVTDEPLVLAATYSPAAAPRRALPSLDAVAPGSAEDGPFPELKFRSSRNYGSRTANILPPRIGGAGGGGGGGVYGVGGNSRPAARRGWPRSYGGAPQPPDVYDQLDQGLGEVQTLCENAAHQFLRDGDFGEEGVCIIERRMAETRAVADREMARVRAEGGSGSGSDAPGGGGGAGDEVKARRYRPATMRRENHHSATKGGGGGGGGPTVAPAAAAVAVATAGCCGGPLLPDAKPSTPMPDAKPSMPMPEPMIVDPAMDAPELVAASLLADGEDAAPAPPTTPLLPSAMAMADEGGDGKMQGITSSGALEVGDGNDDDFDLEVMRARMLTKSWRRAMP